MEANIIKHSIPECFKTGSIATFKTNISCSGYRLCSSQCFEVISHRKKNLITEIFFNFKSHIKTNSKILNRKITIMKL